MIRISKKIYWIIAASILIAGIIFINQTGIYHLLTLENLKTYAQTLLAIVEQRYLLSAALFVCFYTFVICIFIPGTSVLTLAGGVLFGAIWGTVYVNIGATLGSTIVFVAVRHFVGHKLHHKFIHMLNFFNIGLSKKGYLYLLSIRIFPIIPYSMVNIIAGLTKIPLRTFIWTTSLGNIPATLLVALAGKEIRHLKSMNDLFNPRFFIILVTLALLALSPIVIPKLKKRKARRTLR
jgi:uncharacterized membrane protein YdjX (TVP38/TMEM64 family)